MENFSEFIGPCAIEPDWVVDIWLLRLISFFLLCPTSGQVDRQLRCPLLRWEQVVQTSQAPTHLQKASPWPQPLTAIKPTPLSSPCSQAILNKLGASSALSRKSCYMNNKPFHTSWCGGGIINLDVWTKFGAEGPFCSCRVSTAPCTEGSLVLLPLMNRLLRLLPYNIWYPEIARLPHCCSNADS